MDVLLIGSGGREHALAWKLKQSPDLGKLFIAPGNAGTAQLGQNVPIPATDIKQLVEFAHKNKIGLTIVGPDDPLALGIVDEFQSRSMRIFGPSKAAAQIESSKAFAKQLMQEAHIPTADFQVFSDHAAALNYLHLKGVPRVIKASGLALGKGVSVCHTIQEAEDALREIMVERIHKDAGNEVVIEEYLEGPEISVHALCDGVTYSLFPAAQDHKPALDGDKGKNTGGMGTISPVPWVSPEMMHTIETTVIRPILEAMAFRGMQFRGLLFPGIKITLDGPKVLEFNARFGDPETQVYMRLLKSDLLEVINACVDQSLGSVKLEWLPTHAANIVLASGGYPDAYERGYPIHGLENAQNVPDAVIFHAGTLAEGGTIKTAGGRVLGVSAVGSPLYVAIRRAYAAAELVTFEGKQYRKDIGSKSI